MATHWEYEVIEMNMSERWRPKKQAEEVVKLRDRLNAMGRQGWEMVSYESIPLTGSFSDKIKGYAYLCFLKRPAAE